MHSRQKCLVVDKQVDVAYRKFLAQFCHSHEPDVAIQLNSSLPQADENWCH
jgi:hypothetical protein